MAVSVLKHRRKFAWLRAVKRITQVEEVAGMENGRVLAVNSMARIEHVEIDSNDLNHGFEKLAQHLKQNSLSWSQLLASRTSWENQHDRGL
jgi:hypothetical protein